MSRTASNRIANEPISGDGEPAAAFGHARYAVVAVVLAVHAGLLARGAACQSPTENELAHLAAGIHHWQSGHFALYRVNPPLVRMWAALPVWMTGAQTDWSRLNSAPGARPVFAVGRDFADANGKQTVWLCTLARWSCLPISLFGACVCYLWAGAMWGTPAGLLALVLWCFCPNIIAHGQLITPDVGAAAFGAFACYLFWRWLQQPTWTRALAGGFALGLAELTKTTWLVLYAVLPPVWIVYQWGACRAIADGQRCRESLQISMMLAVSVYTINLGYGFDGSLVRLGDYQFVSRLFAGPQPESTLVGNRFAGGVCARLPIPLPRDYLLGIDVQRRDLEDFGRPSYLRGEWRDRGWWYYYLYGLAVKVPLGTWLLALLTVLLPPAHPRFRVKRRDEWVVLVPALALFTLVSSQTGFSHHFRYVLPAFPFAFVWISQLTRSAARTDWKPALLALAAVVWSVSSSLATYPHSLSYFNELAGGPSNGRAHMIHSSLDWGQDALFLKRWLDRHSGARPLELVYYGHFDPQYAGIDYMLPPAAQTGAPESPPEDLKPGWYAVSINFLLGDKWHAPDGAGGRVRLMPGAYRYFQAFDPVASAGHSILIYHLTAQDIEAAHSRGR